MKHSLISIAALLAFSVPALGDFQTVSRAYELALGDLREPSSQYSAMSFQECKGCERRTVRITANTRYVINGRTVSFERFWEIARETDSDKPIPATVLHNLESDTIVRISFNRK